MITWNDPSSGARNTGRFVLSRPGHAAETFAFELEFCVSPLCGCRDVGFVLHPLDEPVPARGRGGESILAYVDPFAELPSEEQLGGSRRAVSVARELAREFDAADWERLREDFLARKHEAMRDFDPAHAEVEFDFDIIERERELIPYPELFPFEERVVADVRGRPHTIWDHYCVIPECDCTLAIVVLEPVDGDDDDDDGENDESEPLAARVDVVGERWLDIDDHDEGDPAMLAEVQAAVTSVLPDPWPWLRARRDLLRTIYAHSRAAHGRPVGRAPRAGRNDPCPCGSGKKYKRCCGVNG